MEWLCRCLGLALAGEVGDLEWLGEWEESQVGRRVAQHQLRLHPLSWSSLGITETSIDWYAPESYI